MNAQTIKIYLTISIAVALSACAKDLKPASSYQKANASNPGLQVQVPTPSPAPSPSPSPTPSPTPAPSPAPAPAPSPAPIASIASFPVGTTLSFQEGGTIDMNQNVQAYDVDLFAVSASQVTQLKNRGVKVICAFSGGTYEVGAPDVYALSSIGAAVAGSYNEYWLGIGVNATDVTALINSRLDLAKQKGCSAVEVSRLDSYLNYTGLYTSAVDQFSHNLAIVTGAHSRGMAVGFRDAYGIAASHGYMFDFAVTIGCYSLGTCGAYSSLVSANKAVFAIEIGLAQTTLCPTATSFNIEYQIKNSLDTAAATYCRGWTAPITGGGGGYVGGGGGGSLYDNVNLL